MRTRFDENASQYQLMNETQKKKVFKKEFDTFFCCRFDD